MSDRKIELTRRRVLGSVATIGAASAAAGAGTFALFSDEETSDGNTITAGTLDLQSPASGQLTASGVAPGWSQRGTFDATYDSSSTVAPVALGLSLAVSESDAAATPADGDLQTDLNAAETARKFEVLTATVEDPGGAVVADLTSGVNARTTGHPPDGSGGQLSYVDLDQITGSHDGVDTGVSPGDTYTFTLELQVPSRAGNDLQADGVDVGVTFRAEQQTSQ